MTGFILVFWQGKASFAVVLSTLLAAAIACSFFPTESSNVIRFTQATVMVLTTVILSTGALRTGGRLLREKPSALSVWAIYGGVFILLVFVAIQLASLFLPASSVIVHDNRKPPKVTLNGDQIHIEGDIDYRVLTELRPFLASDPPAKSIWMQSTGGHVIAGRSIGLAIERSRLDTIVNGQCYSACTLAFAGGKHRFLPEGATLGFHGYRFDNPMRVQTITKAEIEAKDRIFLARRGVSMLFLDKVYKVPPEDIWIPSREDLLSAGVLTQ